MDRPPSPPPPPPVFEDDPPYEPSRAPQVVAWILVVGAVTVAGLGAYVVHRCSAGVDGFFEGFEEWANERDPWADVRAMEPVSVDAFLTDDPRKKAKEYPHSVVVRGVVRRADLSHRSEPAVHLVGTHSDLRCAFASNRGAVVNAMGAGTVVTIGGSLRRGADGLPELTGCSTPAMWQAWIERRDRRRLERERQRAAEDPDQD